MEQHNRQEQQRRQEQQPLYLTSDAESSTHGMPVYSTSNKSPIQTLRGGNRKWNLPIPNDSSTNEQNNHEIAFVFRILVVLVSSMFVMFGMVKLFYNSSHKRQRRRKKRLDETMITAASSITVDLEANPKEELERENLLKAEKSVDTSMPIRASSKTKSPAKWLTTVGQDWMSHLDDDLSLAAISIPGSHDSGSRYGGVYVTTQTWSIGQQLDSGIRFLDIRCRREGKIFTIHHGPFYQHLWFDQILEVIRTFLEGHPSETILIRVKEEYDPKEGSDSFVAIWNRYMNELGYGDLLAKYPWDGKTIPTLGQVRGKFVLLRDFAWKGPEIGLHYNRFGNAFMEVQDDYSIPFVNGISKKKSEVKVFLEKAKNRSCQDSCHGDSGGTHQPLKIIINHCSGTKPPVYTPSFVAKRTNKVAYDGIGFSSSDKLCYNGIIVMDFPGESLIHRIILSNATETTISSTSPPTKTPFIISDAEHSA
ncbi:unnamed protein product [Cylindrotheca closterium]|uniref:Phosphatidylinositol-specific phospholipase C X domain-containing protein n=1 Tax=Cylindrotheca closterium TaxID=2856 RepID=A0AAD2FG27_9STRA|nr:unnamed protein product [Cylindrotheca closterium]